MFCDRAISEMIKGFKQLYKGVMPGKSVVIPLNPDELTDVEMRSITRSHEPYKGKNKWNNQGKNLQKWEQAKDTFER